MPPSVVPLLAARLAELGAERAALPERIAVLREEVAEARGAGLALGAREARLADLDARLQPTAERPCSPVGSSSPGCPGDGRSG